VKPVRLLLLAGTGEARELARELAAIPEVAAIASLAGATRQPLDLDLPTRVGGFGGRAGFEAFLKAERIAAVLDATHPFADRISRRTADVCRARGLPCLQLLRPPWTPAPGDRWTCVDHEGAAAEHIPEGATVFLATGPQHLERFANLSGRRLICRRIDPPRAPFPLPGGEYLVDRPPFTVADEIALMRKRGIDWLVTRNSGGQGSRPKLEAARMLGLPVLMISRPAPPPGVTPVESVEKALAWVRSLCNARAELP